MIIMLKDPDQIARAQAAFALALDQLERQGEIDPVTEEYQRMRLEVFVCSFVLVADSTEDLAARAVQRFLRTT